MKKQLLFFILIVLLFTIAKIVYDKYCASKPEGCKKMKAEDREEYPLKGIDW